MFAEELELRRRLIEFANRCVTMDLVIYTQGNLSARIPGTDHILITPSALPYDQMQPEDIVKVDLYVNQVDGIRRPSEETVVHCMAYRERSEIGGCVHVEPPYLNALYAVNKEVPNILQNFVYFFDGKGLARGPALMSTTPAFAEATLEAMGDRYGVVWKNHGLFCVGRDLETAFRRCWVAEQAAHVYWLGRALQAGEPDLVPQQAQASMVAAARRAGIAWAQNDEYGRRA